MFFDFLNDNRKIKPVLNYFCFSILEHCNLNCKYCDHFAPLAKEGYAKVNVIEKHMKRISDLLHVSSIGIMGGEPLLSPDITVYFDMLRNIFPQTLLTMYTNGILLEKQKEEFWESCRKNKIFIRISKFPLDIDFTKVFNIAKEYSISISYYGVDFKKGEEFKSMYKMSLDLKGKQNSKKMSELCWHNKGGCTYFADGKFYQCTTVGNIHNFNNHFKTDLIVTKNDYADIYKIKNGIDIINFLNKRPIPFCKYCNINKRVYGLPFEISKKEITEWSD